MSEAFGPLEIAVEEVARLLASDKPPILLDVREEWETELVQLPFAVELAPLSGLGERGTAALPEAARDRQVHLIVYCHHGIRSGEVAQWLAMQGWANVASMAGGLQAYADRIDPSIGTY